ncbi:uncharacterized protein H6S33_008767 [Morchella sextelata]|uniref:uncharacterized protein n=1 Tax=Morchella sextelata TaxID=1174677 RepID=UPI001D0570AF|nr:uncharacterized protein H6S33_008767 [Morchella sextelata]KAH0602428.1 hypothetical protein H6S33_008767 [Morchella sextelata]
MLLKPRLFTPILRSTLTRTTIRTMSAAPQKIEWLCIMPDQPDALARRVEIRPKHFAGLQALIDSGFINFGGAYLNEPEQPDTPLAFRGSVLTCLAATREEVEETLRKDPYTTGEVWDWTKAQIYPFKCAVRLPLVK